MFAPTFAKNCNLNFRKKRSEGEPVLARKQPSLERFEAKQRAIVANVYLAIQPR